ncbi:hypothetical protein Tco_0678405 [Tanacetum coccineum]|uniref:Uncharacterized protein n=1 Tax=Tanacetum coccineum TaxID=301880 RepID=A0ABQ4XGB0_9ASTR
MTRAYSNNFDSRKGVLKASTSSSNIPTFDPYDLLSQDFDPENCMRNVGELNSALDDMESEEEVEVIYDETTNLDSTIMRACTYTAPDAFKT